MSQQTGLRFGEYLVTEKLGQGAMGIVYKAVNKNGHTVAIKVLKDLSGDEHLKQRFFDEIRICRNLLHPNIVIPIDFAGEPVPYMAFEYINGISLSHALREHNQLALGAIVDIIDQIAHGLQYVHDLGIVHGDLNPHNIMLTRDQRGHALVKIVDFGISRIEAVFVHIGKDLVTPLGTGHDEICGTPGYICPNVFKTRAYSHRSDLFSLGVIAHELFTGRNPFPGKSPYRTLQQPQIADFWALFQTIFRKILAARPKSRHSDALAFLADIEKLARAATFPGHWDAFIHAQKQAPPEEETFYFNTQDLLDWEDDWEPLFAHTHSLQMTKTEPGNGQFSSGGAT